MQRRKSRKKPPLRSIERVPLRTFKVFVHHKAPRVSRPFLLCVEIGFPAHQEPHQEIVQAAAFASKAKIGDTREFAESNAVDGQLCLGANVVFSVPVGKYAGLGAVGTICQLPLVLGISQPN